MPASLDFSINDQKKTFFKLIFFIPIKKPKSEATILKVSNSLYWLNSYLLLIIERCVLKCNTLASCTMQLINLMGGI